MINKPNTPSLRFPQFSGNWEIKKLGEIAGEISYGMNSAAIVYDGVNKYIRITDIDESSRKFVPNPISSPDGKIENKYRLKEGDIVFARTGASVGKTYLYSKEDGDLYFAGFLIKFSIINSNPYFVFIQTLLDEYNKWVKMMSMRSGQPGINAEEYKTFEIKYTTLPEQEKIAGFLTVVDEKLQALKKKKALLEDYKKGIMQRIFSGNLRFKDAPGQPYPDWEVRKLGEVASFKVTNSFSRENLNYESGEVKNIHYGDIHTKFKTILDLKKETVPFVNPEISISRISGENYCQVGDLILADASEDLNDVGKCIELVNLNGFILLAGLHTILIRPLNDIFFSGYLGYLFASKIIRLQIQKEAQGSKVSGISPLRLKNISIPIPSLHEQEKIAEFLSAIDAKIAAIQTQLNKTLEWKKGLLQGMFC
ncbi:MAG: restriction endonuclease subunit S [Cytophagaceae bacterium]|nr:restriction endonuclease subunit S [Cytophagaceae bacterium]MBL0326266.1 restriction endonuclease subunit S [Cytophagaceae bacterium]